MKDESPETMKLKFNHESESAGLLNTFLRRNKRRKVKYKEGKRNKVKRYIVS